MPFTFGRYRFDAATRQVFRDDVEVHFSPKAFDLLQMLIEERPRAISKRDLQERLWPGTFVTEGNLASLVAEVRRALQDPSDNPAFVRTVHRFGYAFSGEVDGAAAPPAVSTDAPMCWVVWMNQEIPLRSGENLIGRDPGLPVRLDFPSVSRRHARIVISAAGASVEDLGSKNGTLIGETRVAGRMPLADFDELQIGSAKLVVRIMRGGEPTQTRDL